MIKGNTLILTKKAAILIVLAVVFVFALIAFILLNQKMLSKPRQLAFSPDSEYAFTGNGFLYIAGSSVKYSDLTETSKNYTGKLPHGDMQLSGYGRDTHVVYDSATLCIIGLTEAVTPAGSIEDVVCGDGFAACLISDGDQRSVCVYNLKGEKVEEITSDDTITDFGFTHSAKEQLYVITLNTASDALVSTIRTYDPSVPAMTGIITVQDQLIEDIIFTKKSIYVSGTTNLIRYDAADNRESYRLIKRGYHVNGYYEKDNNVYFMMYANENDNRSVRIYSTSQSTVPSERIVPLQLPDNTLGVFVHEDYIYAVTAAAAYRYNMSGTLKKSEAIDVLVDSVYTTGKGNLIIASENRLFSVSITGTNFLMQMFEKK